MRLAKCGHYIRFLGQAGAWVAGVSLFVMTVIGAMDIISTKFLSLPIPGAFEGIESLMVLSVFMALASVQARRQHISVDIVSRRLSPSTQQILELLGDLLSLVLFFVIAWQGWAMGWRSWVTREYSWGLIQFPMYPSKMGLGLGASLMVLQCLKDLLIGAKAWWERHPEAVQADNS